MKFLRHHFFACTHRSVLGRLGGGPAQAIRLRPGCFAGDPDNTLGDGRVVRAAPWAGEDVPRTIAEIVQQAGARDGDLNLYRYQPVIYALARLHPPTPMTLEISEFSESAHTDGVAEMEQIIGARPRFVVKSEGTLGGSAEAVDDVLTRSLTQ